MSNSEIQSWISASTANDNDDGFGSSGPAVDDSNDIDEDDGDDSTPRWQRDRVFIHWDNSLQYAQHLLLTAKTSARVKFLQDELLSLAKHADMSLAQTLDVFQLLTQTYPKYADAPSKDAVEAVGVELVRRDELRERDEKLGVTEQILGWLANEVGTRVSKRGSPSSYASADIYVLLSWSCGLYSVCLSTNPELFTATHPWRVLVGTTAMLLDNLMTESIRTKPSMKKGALVRTRRALRSAPERLPVLMKTLLAQSKTSATPLVFVSLLGVAVDVTIRLKYVKDESMRTVSPEIASEIVALYANTILASKTLLPSHVPTALHDFIRTSVTDEHFTSTILPAMEKGALRSPENSLPATAQFFTAYPHPLSPDAFTRTLTIALNTAKSTNPTVRTASVSLFSALITSTPSSSHLETATTDLFALPKAGKTTGAEHRNALYAMLACLPASEPISTIVVREAPALLAKETTHEAPIKALADALPAHLAYLIQNGEKKDSLVKESAAFIGKEMASGTKAVVRKAFCVVAGSVLWDLGGGGGAGAGGKESVFAKEVFAAAETSLRTVAANPLGGPLEGYVALAVLLGPLARSGHFDEALGKNATVQGIPSTAVKPSFLLWDKVYQRGGLSEEDQRWLIRACVSVVGFFKTELTKNELFRTQLGAVFLHLALDGSTPEIRRDSLDAIKTALAQNPTLVSRITREAVKAFLAKGVPSTSTPSKPAVASSTAKVPADKAAGEEPVVPKPWNRHGRLALFLLSSVSFEEGEGVGEVSKSLREEMLVELVVVAHHELACPGGRQTWIELCQRARVDPRALVTENLNKLLERILASSIHDSKNAKSDAAFAAASYSAVSTLAFVAPDIALPRIVEQLRRDFSAETVAALTDEELSIWATEEGTLFVDVLTLQKEKKAKASGAEAKKGGKDHELAKWDAELRKSLASKTNNNNNSSTVATSKQKAPPPLTKQELALVNAQLLLEGNVRNKVRAIQVRLVRGLCIARALAKADVGEFKDYLGEVARLVREGVLSSEKGARLVGGGEVGFEVYLELGQCCTDRLGTFRTWVGVATLRSLNATGIPDSLQAEPLNSLVIRVLYRLRSLSEQAPFDAATFSYAFPLLAQVLVTGGVDIAAPTDEDDAQQREDALEQLALVLDIIKFHVGEFSSRAFPRTQTMQHLLLMIQTQPKLSSVAADALIALGESIAAASIVAQADAEVVAEAYPGVSVNTGSGTRAEIAVLLQGTLVQEVHVRNACLQTLQPFDLTDLDWSPELWLACHDEDVQNARLARHVWEDNGLDVPEQWLEGVLEYLGHEYAYVRSSASAAIAEALEHWPMSITNTLVALEDYYREKAKILAPEFDEYGMVLSSSLDRSDPWPARLFTARTFELLAPFFSPEQIEPFFRFLITSEALGDREGDVRRGMLAAGTAVIDLHGLERLAELIAMFEDHLSDKSSYVATTAETGDHIKEAIVILFGRVARHLDSSDARIPLIIDRLVEALQTPSQQVHIAVSDCLPPLVKALPQNAIAELFDRLMAQLLTSERFSARKGAAYGLAGLLKGTGIGGMKQFDVMRRLRSVTDEKTNPYEAREGALLAFETLATILGRHFEPYVPSILPLLLSAFGDGVTTVREAAVDAARAIMGNLSGYGVKLILPSLLEGLDEKQWRTKKGSIELLGMMAYCAPRQLAKNLPIVIPRLSEVLTDTHAQVRASAKGSLKKFGDLIENPEIKALVPVFLKALGDPGKASGALTALLKTPFMHYIDHSSLALVLPIIERGLRERGAESKKKAAQIVGNLASLTSPADFIPYLAELLPLMHIVLVDPVPEARATAAKALGTLVSRLGEEHFPDLVPGLLRTLKADGGGVDRQGAAQGLSEVLSGLGMERLEGLLPDIIASAHMAAKASVREGFMALLVFLPATFGVRFQPHLGRIIAPILAGLADNEEGVREAAMKAGRMVVGSYAGKAVELLLPELERGMCDPGWRIRQSSITLVGELLFKITGVAATAASAENEVQLESATSTEHARKALVEVLGVERKDRILAALYIVRQDGVVAVRQAGMHIWKAMVGNTPRTVREILPELMNQVIALISGDEFEQQETASRTIAEICHKFGDKVLGELVGILRTQAASGDARTREGVSRVVGEVMENTTPIQRESHTSDDALLAIIRAALIDDTQRVRVAAARAFDVLQAHLGGRAIDETIPSLLEALRLEGANAKGRKGPTSDDSDDEEEEGTALRALREVMSVRATTVFPVLLPTLLATPMTVFNANALASLVSVAGGALSRRVTTIVAALVAVLETEGTESEVKDAVNGVLEALFEAIEDAEGLNTLMMLLIGWAKHDSPKRRVSAFELFSTFCESSELDSSLYRVDWIRQLVSSLEDPHETVYTAASSALAVFAKSIPKDELEPLVVPLRRAIEGTGGPGLIVAGLSLSGGVTPMVPIIIAGLTTGSNEQREHAAYAIGDLVTRTEPLSFKPFVVPFTGPLIRVATQSTTYPPAVKTAILSALTDMLIRVPTFVRPFFPQLQRTFVKSASDPASGIVRRKAGFALGELMKSQPRVDPVVTELIAGVKGNADDGIRSSLVGALARVVKSASNNLGEKAREACVELVADAFRDTAKENEHYVQAIAALFASLSPYDAMLRPLIESYLVAGTPQTTLSSLSIVAVLSPDEDEDTGSRVNVFQKLSLLRSVAQKVLESVANERPIIARPAREARDLLREMDGEEALSGLF